MEPGSNEIPTKMALENSNVQKIQSFFEDDTYYW